MAAEFKLLAECSDLTAEVLLNGLPVFYQTGGMNTRNTIVNQWMVGGRNSIEVRIERAGDINPADVSAHLACRLSSSEDVVYAFSWQPGDSKSTLPYSTRAAFISDVDFIEWAWQRAELLKLDQTVIHEINRFLQRIHNALNTADLTETMMLFRLKAEEQAIAYEMPVVERINQQRRFFEDWFRQPGWGMKPVDYERLNYRLYAGNRVVLVEYKDRSDVLESKPVGEGEMISFPLFLSRIDRQWTVVR